MKGKCCRLSQILILAVLLVGIVTAGLPVAAQEIPLLNPSETAIPADPLLQEIFISPDFTRDGRALIGGQYLYRTNDWGRSWERLNWDVGNRVYENGLDCGSWYTIQFLPDDRLGLGYDGLFFSGNGGKKWDEVKSASFDFQKDRLGVVHFAIRGNQVQGLISRWQATPFSRYYLDLTKYYSNDGGINWSYQGSGAGEFNGRLVAVDEDVLIARFNRNQLRRSVDGGLTWQDVLTGIDSQGDLAVCSEADGRKTVVACSPEQAAVVYVSRDSGATWQQAESERIRALPLSSLSINSVAAAPGGIIFAGNEDGQLLVSEDYGNNWSILGTLGYQDLNRIRCAPVDSGVLLLAVNDQGIHRLTYQPAAIKPKPPASTVISFPVGKPQYTINGRPVAMDAAAFIEQERVFIPVRYLAEAVGAAVAWDAETRTVRLNGNGRQLKMQVNAAEMLLDGRRLELPAAPLLRNDRLYLPLRSSAEAFGFTPVWEQSSQTAVLTREQ